MNADEILKLHIGNLFFQVVTLQAAIEERDKKIAELEAQLPTAPVVLEKPKLVK